MDDMWLWLAVWGTTLLGIGFMLGRDFERIRARRHLFGFLMAHPEVGKAINDHAAQEQRKP